MDEMEQGNYDVRDELIKWAEDLQPKMWITLPDAIKIFKEEMKIRYTQHNDELAQTNFNSLNNLSLKEVADTLGIIFPKQTGCKSCGSGKNYSKYKFYTGDK